MSVWISALNERSIQLTRYVSCIGVIGILLIAAFVSVDVVVFRWVLNAPISGSNEIFEMGIGLAAAACFPIGIAQRSHLTMDLLEQGIGPSASGWLKAIGEILLLFVVCVLAWRLGIHALILQKRAQLTIMLGLPMAPFIWGIAGFLAFCIPVQFIAYLTSVRDALVVALHSDFEQSYESDGTGDGRPGSPRVSTGKFIAASLTLLMLMGAAIIAFQEVLGPLSALASAKPILFGTLAFVALWVAVMLLTPVGAAMALTGLAGAIALMGIQPASGVFGSVAVEFLANLNFGVLPMFLMMGSFAAAAGLSPEVYSLAHACLGHFRGGLAMATVGACASFGAVTGSSLATSLTIGKVALPEMKKRGYSQSLTVGSIGAGGTLGQLVPPSTAIVVYGILVEESIGRLLIAVLIPAAISVAFYVIVVRLYLYISPGAAPAGGGETFDYRNIIRALRKSWGVFLLFGCMVGGIYAGIFTATEGGAVGVVGTFLFALLRGKLAGGAFWRVMGEAANAVCVLYVVILGALMFSFFMAASGLPSTLTALVTGLDVRPLAIIGLLLIAYLLLGAVMDSMAVMMITVPILAPVITGMGYDLIWWGIVMVVVAEAGMITPPFGLNIFVLKSVSEDFSISDIYRGMTPFILADMVKLILLVLFPVLILWLPSMMMG
jgi:tripartite ATP-independent transporter DctM subunit